MTASPYHQGTNDKASDKALYKMEGELAVKEPHEIILEEPSVSFVEPVGQADLVAEAEEKLNHINSSYTLNDYFLPRGFANIYVSGLGTKDSQGLMPMVTTDKLKLIKMSLIGSMAVAVPSQTIVVNVK